MEPQRSNQSGTTRVGMDGVIRRGPVGAPLNTRTVRPITQATSPSASQAPARPVARPAQAQPAPAPTPRPQSKAQPAPAQTQRPVAPPRQRRSHNGLKVFLQTLLALIVILGVAVAIVVLYLRYYQ